MKKSIITLLWLCTSVSLSSAEIKILPLIDARVNGGKSVFRGSSDSLKGSCELILVPVIKFSERFSLLPQYEVKYFGQKSSTELAGGGRLHPKEQNHLISVKVINKFDNELKLKNRAGYKWVYLKETKDESWGDSLFNWDKVFGAIELEKKFKRHPVIFEGRFEYYQIRYPNYDSLSAKAPDPDWRELSGKKPLDYNANEIFMKMTCFLNPKVRLGGEYIYTHNAYTNQLVVDEKGNASPKKRRDNINEIKLSLMYFPEIKTSNRGATSLRTSYTCKITDSNQNHFDTNWNRFANVQRKNFIHDFFDTTLHKISPQITFKLPQNKDLTLTYEYGYTKYKERLAQNKEGYYKNERMYSRSQVYDINLLIPLNKGFSIDINGNFKNVDSNMKYERFYNYDYRCRNYSIGLLYQY